DDIAARQAQRPQPAGQAADLAVEFTIAVCAPRAVFAFPVEASLVVGRRSPPAVECIEHDVGGSADAPAGPGRATRFVDHGIVGALEAELELVEERAMEARRVLVATPDQVLPGLEPEFRDEARRVRRLRKLAVRMPGVARRVCCRHGWGEPVFSLRAWHEPPPRCAPG